MKGWQPGDDAKKRLCYQAIRDRWLDRDSLETWDELFFRLSMLLGMMTLGRNLEVKREDVEIDLGDMRERRGEKRQVDIRAESD